MRRPIVRRLRARFELPGIRWLLTVFVVLLLAPLCIVGVDLIDSSQRASAAAQRVEAAATRLEGLLLLAPALRDEQNAVAASIGQTKVAQSLDQHANAPHPESPATVASQEPTGDDLPAAGMPVAGGNDGPPSGALVLPRTLSEVEPTSRRVDELLALVGDRDIRNRVDAVRRFAAEVSAAELEPQRLYELLDEYNEVFGRVESRIDDAMFTLRSEAAAAGGNGDLATAATVAEIATERRVLHATQFTLWSSTFAPGSEATTGEVIAIADSLARAGEAKRDLEHLLATDRSALGDAWAELRTADALMEFVSTIQASVERTIGAGTDVGSPAPGADGAPAGLTQEELGQFIDRMAATMALEQEAADALSTFAEAALAEVHRQAGLVRAQASAHQRSVAVTVLAFLLLAVGAVWLMVRTVAAPLRRMADGARSLRDGNLDLTIASHGAAEVRLTAQALSEAAGSLKLAEDQAVALAEGRLTDESLDRPVPGTLGRSLRNAVARLARTLSERESLQRRLAHEAAHDSLTGLPNRNAVMRSASAAIARADRTELEIALLFVDLDAFKAVNDTHGHHAGDALLRSTADRLRSEIRGGDVAGRLGGDEFVVVAEPVTGLDEAMDLGRRLRAALSRPVEFGDLTLEPSVSVGVALGDRTGLTATELLHDADLAVYRAKRLGRGRVEHCDETLREQAREQTEIEQALASALENDELVLHFQPTVDCDDHRIRSLEALVRWNRPGVGVVQPGDFIPAAERTDLIEHVDRWVLKAAADQLADWTAHPVLGSLPIAVNVSSRHLSSGSLVDDVVHALSSAGVDRRRLEIEVTETALLDDVDQASCDLDELRRLGVRVALDDFGTGYMSLATLRALPVDVLKIDRSFVAELSETDDHSMVELIIEAGRMLGIAVVAEGVENAEQARVLRRLGVQRLQGWLFARPADSDSIEHRVEISGTHLAPAPDVVPV